MRVIKRHSCGDTIITLQSDADRSLYDYEVQVEVIDSQAEVTATYGAYIEALEAWRYAVSEATGEGDDPMALLKVEPVDPFTVN
jgi:hypothetical protein